MNPSNRNLSLDIFKGLGIIYMIIAHQIVWLFTYGDGGGLLYPDSYRVFSFFRLGLHALVLQLPVIAGASLFLSLRSRSIPFRIVLQRSCILILLGFLLNCLSWGPMATLTWDVLPFIGLSTLISYPFIKNFSKKSSWVILILIAILCLGLSDRFPLAFLQDSYIYKIMIGDITGENYWPFCPWYVLFAAGIFLGRVLEAEKKEMFERLSAIGAIFLFLYAVSEIVSPSAYFTEHYDYQNAWGASLFKPPAIFVLGIIGFSLTLIPLLHRLLQRSPDVKHILARSFLTTYAQGIAWIYILSIVFGYRATSFLTFHWRLGYTQATLLLPLLITCDLLLAYLIGRIVSAKRNVQYR